MNRPPITTVDDDDDDSLTNGNTGDGIGSGVNGEDGNSLETIVDWSGIEVVVTRCFTVFNVK